MISESPPPGGLSNKGESTMAYQWKNYTVGVCYYPEHWPEEMWESDLTRMLAAGITVVRVAEFAWSKVEPREGEFTFDFFQRFLDLCEKCGMKVIFGTPTATPPAWLTRKYPEVLNSTMEGVLYRHGGRRHYNYNSPVYRRLCARIVEQIASRYGQHPAIVGWQIDNELNCETDEFHSEADGNAFRQYLRKKFGTLDALNKAMGTTFWNQTYTHWAEVDVPRLTPGTGRNPHIMVEYIRFVSESAISFCEMQAAILRLWRKEGDFITTNGLFANYYTNMLSFDGLGIDVSDVTSLAELLKGATSLQKFINVATWKTDNVTSMHSLLEGTSAMQTIDSMEADATNGYWDTSQVTDFGRLFYGMGNFAKLNNYSFVKDWDVTSASSNAGEGFTGMFARSSVQALDLSGWNMPDAAAISGMLEEATHLSTLTLSPSIVLWRAPSATDIDPAVETAGLESISTRLAPGSIFKMVTGIAGAAEGVLDINELISCDWEYIIRYTDENGKEVAVSYTHLTLPTILLV